MKCDWCGKEWLDENSRVKFACPYCRKQIVWLDKSFCDLETALAYLVENYGADVYDDKMTILEFIDIFLSGKKRERNFINIAYSSGSVKIIQNAKNFPDNVQRSMLEMAVNKMIEEYGIDEEWASFVVGTISRSLGISVLSCDSITSLRNRAEAGNIESQYKLALYYYSQGMFSDYKFWIKKTIEGNMRDAKYHYGVYLVSNESSAEYPDEGAELIMQLAMENDIDAICYLGRHQEILKDRAFDVKRYIREVEGASEKLKLSHWLDLSYYYENANQLELAINAAEKAYIMDKISSWERYADLLEKRNEKSDDFIAGKILREIIEEGNIRAMYRLANKLDRKAKNASDMEVAIYWYKMASDGGSIEAICRLAEIYEQGYLIDKDLKKAIYWYEILVISGSKEAFEKIRYKSSECICKTIELEVEDEDVECEVNGVINVNNQDYLIITDPYTRELIPLIYNEDMEHLKYDIDMVDESEEKLILRYFRRSNRKWKIF